MNTGFMNTGL